MLQDNVIERLGGNRRIPLDIRVVAATNREPRKAIEEGRLREDLYYRINVFSIDLPPLRQRSEDIPQLARQFIADLCGAGLSTKGITHEALELLETYDWPGNVRELRNLIERAIVLATREPCSMWSTFRVEWAPQPQLLEAGQAVEPDALDLNRAIDALESKMIAEALRRSGGNKTKAAAILKISGRSLWYKLDKYKIDK